MRKNGTPDNLPEKTNASLKVYSKEEKKKICDIIFEKIANGENSTTVILAEKGMPAFSTFLTWIAEDELLSKCYARAREMKADFMFEEAIAIADDASNDYEERVTAKGVKYLALDKDAIQRSRLRVEARFRAIAIMNPQKYGDKLEVKQVDDTERIVINMPKSFIQNNKD